MVKLAFPQQPRLRRLSFWRYPLCWQDHAVKWPPPKILSTKCTKVVASRMERWFRFSVECELFQYARVNGGAQNLKICFQVVVIAGGPECKNCSEAESNSRTHTLLSPRPVCFRHRCSVQRAGSWCFQSRHQYKKLLPPSLSGHLAGLESIVQIVHSDFMHKRHWNRNMACSELLSRGVYFAW